MQNFIREASFNTPYVNLDPQSGKLFFEGKSIPEDPGEFYDGVLDWLRDFFSRASESPVVIEFKLEYANSGSSKYLLELLRLIERYYKQGRDCKIIWQYEKDDESIQELGEHY